MTVLGFDHLVLRCGDVETTLAWYQRHVGLTPVRVDEWRAGTAPFPSLRVDAGTILDFIPAGRDGQGHLDHICFVVPGGELAAVRSTGELTIVDQGERFGARGVATSIYVHDPDGLLVELRAYPDRAGG
jgi:catechol 2,3-dioxygenase-like lactoylglutathione lyase family enzyme